MEQPSIDSLARPDRRRFFSDLVTSGRFCRDTPVGGVLHRGTVSLREISDGDSLHVCVDGDDRVTVHIDHFSPVAGARTDGTCRYSVGAVVAHLVAHVRDQVRRAASGARGRHRCRLECDLVELSGEEAEGAPGDGHAPPPAPGSPHPAGTPAGCG